MKIRIVFAAAIGAAALALAGCSAASDTDPSTAPEGHGDHGSSPSTDAPAADSSAADLMFAGMMIGHHQQAIEMSDILLEKTDVNEDVAALAERIKAAQAPEIEQLTSWVTAWGGDPADYEGMAHGGGMMSQEDMDALTAADGAAASKLYLEQMIEHHEGAVDMANEQIETGQNPDALALAEKIVTDQTSEIDEMRTLLDELS